MRSALGILAILAVVVGGCSEGDGDNTGSGGTGGSAGSGGSAGGADGSFGTGGTGGTAPDAGGSGAGGEGGSGGGTGGSGGVDGGDAGSGAAGGGDGGDVGVDGGEDGEIIPTGGLDMLLLVDDSLSMATTTFAWAPVTGAINGFVDSLESEGIGVGLTWFSEGCSAAEFAVPDVTVGKLPANAKALTDEVDSHMPAGNSTQTMYAIRGATEHTRQHALGNPGRKIVIVLMTDGLPELGMASPCVPGPDSDLDNTAQAAEDAYEGSPSIPVYVIGAGVNLENLDTIAAAGGTDKAFIIVNTSDGIQALTDVMNAARE
jgi:hypothetical protein